MAQELWVSGAGTMGQRAETVGSYTRAVVRAVRRQSACAELTRRAIRNVRVRAPKTSECVRRSVRNVESAYLTLVGRVTIPLHDAKGAGFPSMYAYPPH